LFILIIFLSFITDIVAILLFTVTPSIYHVSA
jgi:hypothetical protein